jgi:uncharacterized membrane protein YfcA
MLRRRRQPKQLNIPLLKGVIMGALSAVIGLGSAFTGLGAQVAAAPTIDFMLGYAVDRTAGSAMVVALCAAVAGVGAAHLGGTPVDAASALLVTVGATVGVMAFGGRKAGDRLMRLRLLAQGVVVVGMLFVMSAALRGGPLGPEPFDIRVARGPIGLIGIGFLCGLMSAAFEVTTGALLVPGLVFVGAKRPDEAIAISLIVVAIASSLPVLGHVAAGRLDLRMCVWMGGGAAAGGWLGGWLLALCREPVHPAPLLVFAAFSMFASAAYSARHSGAPVDGGSAPPVGGSSGPAP